VLGVSSASLGGRKGGDWARVKVRERRKPVLARWSDEFATQYDKGVCWRSSMSDRQAVVRTQGSESGRS
jgi:hypothetical protein